MLAELVRQQETSASTEVGDARTGPGTGVPVVLFDQTFSRAHWGRVFFSLRVRSVCWDRVLIAISSLKYRRVEKPCRQAKSTKRQENRRNSTQTSVVGVIQWKDSK